MGNKSMNKIHLLQLCSYFAFRCFVFFSLYTLSFEEPDEAMTTL